MRGCLPMINELLDNAQKKHNHINSLLCETKNVDQDLVSKRKYVTKSMIYVLKQKKGATLTTTREKKDNEINDLGQNGQNWGYPYYYTRRKRGYPYYYTRFFGVPLLLHKRKSEYRCYYTKQNMVYNSTLTTTYVYFRVL